MTEDQKNIIRQSWNTIQPMAEEAGKVFYRKLFYLAPGVRPLFKPDITEQANKLMQVLRYVVEHLDDMQNLVHEIEELGVRHNAYGAEPAHYEAIGTCLLETFAEMIGPQWTPEVRNAWTTAYYQIKHTMIVAQTKSASVHTK